MQLEFHAGVAASYSSAPQRIRVISEDWIDRNIYCPNCGRTKLTRAANNKPVYDFRCDGCAEEFELKSSKAGVKRKLPDGAYDSMMRRLGEDNNPNLLWLSYSPSSMAVTDLVIIPKHFFGPHLIEKRRPLAASARRAGWVGCNILLGDVPAAGRISMIRGSKVEPKANVVASWRETLFLRRQESGSRRWLISLMRCIDRLGKPSFSLNDIYGFEGELAAAYPRNNHVRAKIRQQLQVLRDQGYLEFVGQGRYRNVISR